MNKQESKLIDRIHSKILKELIDGKAPMLSKHLNNGEHCTYPVVIGGANIMRCSSLSVKAKQMIGTIHKNDLDIKWVICKRIKDNKDPLAIKAHTKRMDMLKAVMNDKTIASRITTIAHNMSDKKISVTLTLRNMGTSVPSMMRKAQMWVIFAQYVSNHDDRILQVKELVDTGLYSNLSQEFFGSYTSSRPIPVHMHKGIPFATCGWTYYDTVRMLILYGERYRKVMANPDAVRNRRWMFLRYLKYLAKFAVLYTQINKLEGRRFDAIKDVYKRVKRALGRSAQIMRGDKELEGISKRSDLIASERRVMADLLAVLETQTNMKDLEAIIAKGDHVINMKH